MDKGKEPGRNKIGMGITKLRSMMIETIKELLMDNNIKDSLAFAHINSVSCVKLNDRLYDVCG